MSTVLPESPAVDASGVDSVLDLDGPPTSLDADSGGLSLTEAEWLAIDEYDPAYRYELLDGRVVVSPAPNWRERSVNGLLEHLLRLYRQTEIGKSVDPRTLSEHDVRTSHGVRRADRAIWCGLGRKPRPGFDTPTIAVEIVSKQKRDRHRDFVEKRREYLEAVVKEYWIIDPNRRTLTVCKTPAGPEGKRVFKVPATYRTDLLPGFELSLGTLLDATEDFEG